MGKINSTNKNNMIVKDLIWRGNYNATRGFGIVSNNLISELKKSFNIHFLPVDHPDSVKPNFNLHIDKKLQQSLLINCVNNYKIPSNIKNKQIFITACEGTKCSAEILEIEKYISQIWVPSTHSMSGLINTGVRKDIKVVQNGIDIQLFKSNNNNDIKSKKFRFLSVFRWTWRKAPEILIEAFTSEFKSNEAELIIKTGIKENHFIDIPNKLPTNIKIITNVITQEELINLYLSSHVFVLPTRGEGWGLPFTEAGALNIPIIATNWGGQLDFLNNKNSLLIEFDGLVSPPNIGKKKDNLFADPSIDDLKMKMRYSFNNYNECLIKSKILQREIENKWTWKESSSIASKLICEQI